MDAGEISELLLGEPSLLAEGDQAVGEGHVVQNGTEGVLRRSHLHSGDVSIARAHQMT